jgi:hypothetical protein
MVANDFETKYEELVATYAKLLENVELLKNDSRVVSSEPLIFTESHEKLKASNSNELTKLPSPLSISIPELLYLCNLLCDSLRA